MYEADAHTRQESRAMYFAPRFTASAAIAAGTLSSAAAADFGACPSVPPDPEFLAAVESASGYAHVPYDPMIALLISRVSADSIRATMERLVAFDNRFTFSDSLVAAESWIESKFESFGGYDPVLQSVGLRGFQRNNIYVELEGDATPPEWVVVGGHHDSINWIDYPSIDDPYAPAPGADDNGSGTAAVLEMARLTAGLSLPRTLRFTTFTIEELGLLGSERMASSMEALGQTVRLMINLDMVAHDPQGGDEIEVGGSGIIETHLVRAVVDTYSDHTWVDGGWPSNSDHYSFSQHGHPAVNLIEADFNWGGWHHSSDEMWRLDIDYCAEVTRVGLAMALVTAGYPAPVPSIELTDAGDGSTLVASWPAVLGAERYLLRWGAISGVPTEEREIADTTATITGLSANELVHVSVAALDDDDRLSWWMPEAADAPLTLEGGVLVIDETIDGNLQEAVQDSLIDVYLKGADYEQLDLAQHGELSIADLGGHSTVIWMGEDPVILQLEEHGDLLGSYQTRGGHLLLSTWTEIGSLVDELPGTFEEGSFGREILGIDQVTRVVPEDFAGADPEAPGYSALRVWERFWPDGTMPMAEIIEPAAGAEPLLSFVSASGDTSLQGRPVALRHPGSDGAGDVYTLGVPLFYMRPSGARAWFLQVLGELGVPVGLADEGDAPPAARGARLRVAPNPFNPRTAVSFHLDRSGATRLTVLDITGRKVAQLLNRSLSAGEHRVVWDGRTESGRSAASGVYVMLLESGSQRWSRRVVLLK